VGCDVIVRNSEDVLTEMPLDVPPAGLNDVVVAATSGVSMHGHISFDGRMTRPEHLDIWLTPAIGGDEKPADWDSEALLRAGGLMPGGYAVHVSDNAEPHRWFVRSMTMGRLDLTTRPIVIDREDASGIDVTMTDLPSPLDGRIVDATGEVVRDATVVVFPVSRDSWLTAHDRLMGFARMRSLDGTYRFVHLVPGDYFVAAVDERRMGDWPRQSFLESIAKEVSPAHIAPGKPLTLKLTLQER